MLIAFASSLDSDQDLQKSGSKSFDTLSVFLKQFLEKIILQRVSTQQTKKMFKISQLAMSYSTPNHHNM